MSTSTNKLIIIAVLFLVLTFLIGIPLVDFELGWDSYRTHELSKLIQDKGYIAYNIHPASIFGYFPQYSYAAGGPLFLAELSYLIGIELAIAVKIISIIITLLGICSLYILAKKINNAPLFIFIVVLCYTLSPGLLVHTTWSFSTRPLLIAILPLFIFFIIKGIEEKKIKYLFCAIIIISLLTLIHKLWILSILYIIVLLGIVICKRFQGINEGYQIIGLLILSVLLLIVSFFIKFNIIIQDMYVLLFHLVRDIGVTIIFWIFGYVFLILKKEKTLSEWFLLMSSLMMLPFIAIQEYFPIMFFPIIYLVIGFGIFNTINYFMKREFFPKQIVSLIVLIIIISALILQISHQGMFEKGNVASEEQRLLTYRGRLLADYIEKNIEGNLITGDIILEPRISVFFPCKIIGRNIAAVSCNYISKEDIPITQASPFSESFWFESFYQLQGNMFVWQIGNMWTWFGINSPEVKDMMEKYGITHYIANKGTKDRQVLLDSLKIDNNKIYDSGRYEVWSME
jgi:hypothetical protein